MDRFTHNQYGYTRVSRFWMTDSSWHYSDLYREMDSLNQEGIPLEAMRIEHMEFDRRSYQRLVIDFSADEQIATFVECQHQAWLAQKAIDDERYKKQHELALANQQAQGMMDWEI